jgi:Fic family protein
MASPNKKLAESLEVLRLHQKEKGSVIKTSELSRTHRERLLKGGFIQEVIQGWYIVSPPDNKKGDSTIWYSSYWEFCARYLNDLFKNDWWISADQSLLFHSGNLTIPKQLFVRSPKATNKLTKLIYETSILRVNSSLPDNVEIVVKDGLRLYSLPGALINCGERFFLQNSTDVRTVLAMIQDSSEILQPLLAGGHSVIAGRLAGGFRNIGRKRIAIDILKTMQEAGYNVRETDPFKDEVNYEFTRREISPQVNRVKIIWNEMRLTVLKHFPKPKGLPKNINKYLKQVDDIFVTDAYHSLSIEGYKVTAELIEKVRSGKWNPEQNEKDKEHRNAMAAKGYWQAFQSVKESIGTILKGENSGKVADEDHRDWYRKMFGPSVEAGILKASDLAGYRNSQVYIRNSSHIPMKPEALRDVIPEFFELLINEKEPAVRVVLGHFMFVYIHPYMDGNGRIGRFLMNTMLASGGYPWTVIPLNEREEYMSALEAGSVSKNIEPFSRFLSKLVKAGLNGKPVAKRL